ncbi:DUF6503 family protein [Nonlabens sp.]|uniref:DUF6503 family protein n=1 Tax=Nonlabens sp. TaxID=1888209 RepID=UPI0025E10334|nr:DUF6503 family protein [Nonlabens sp.]
MKKNVLLLFAITTILFSCTNTDPDARAIMDQAMNAHGTTIAAKGTLSFNFRGIDYSVERDNGRFVYQRHLMIGADTILDRLDNKGFSRYSNGMELPLADSLLTRYTSSLNSVIYFAQLPYSLDGEAIQLQYIAQDTINGKAYHELQVTFKEEGGGEDHEDEFMYWINTQDHLIDYMAYSYCEEECGYRFRESENRRNINGIILQDYNNFKALNGDADLSKMDDMFEKGELLKVSDIDLKRASFKNN